MKTDRENLEWLVFWDLSQDNPSISIGRGKELLNFKYMDDMREWLFHYDDNHEIKKNFKGKLK